MHSSRIIAGSARVNFPLTNATLQICSTNVTLQPCNMMLQDDLAGLSCLTTLESLKLTGPSAPPCRVSAGLAAGLAPLVQLQVRSRPSR